MFNVVLFEPEQPGNVGNIIRLCANAGVQLHIIKPIPFAMDDKKLRRAGLDYHEYVHIKWYDSYADFKEQNPQARVFSLTTKGSEPYHQVEFAPNDFFLFGPESRGLPDEVRNDTYGRIRIPMAAYARSINLANSVSICLYEALRQQDFPNLTAQSPDFAPVKTSLLKRLALATKIVFKGN
ncbi:tRNA (cytidine(34)-2'-O)-methyltransferase [Psittacicella gerlachiana]|uniref:tRNA (cytidine(34)-2'-O)-methyltransferase n=1 Tax=Psittacicella gerlachiana TaxID=2028574 RepID=A0A3A1YIT9_9GAMM|nr:tRNA (cytidine(34)-2'-O)-methyltransferase [Psittacicella gerlachiana]RIY37179.1 hypothetical protein CKF59_01870 [Psittacicella gerlachiana]